jgi:malate dehydrogenase (decarboxylating)
MILFFDYRSSYLMFNDDIQGTAATVLAGIYGALKVQGLPPSSLTKLKFVVCGAGSASAGVMLTIRNAMLRRFGMSEEEGGAKFFILDEHGLITKARKNLLELEENFYSLTSFAEDDTSMEGMTLMEVCTGVDAYGLECPFYEKFVKIKYIF